MIIHSCRVLLRRELLELELEMDMGIPADKNKDEMWDNKDEQKVAGCRDSRDKTNKRGIPLRLKQLGGQR